MQAHIIENLGPMADKTAELSKAQCEAHGDVQTAEGELLVAVVDRIRPALRALSSRIQRSYHSWWIDSVCTTDEDTCFEDRGLLVCGDGVERDHPASAHLNRGRYAGGDLFLLSDGRWMEVVYSGHWSCWRGESDEWAGEPQILTTVQVAMDYPISTIVRAISEALDRQVSGRREKTTKAARARAEKMRALTSLLG